MNSLLLQSLPLFGGLIVISSLVGVSSYLSISSIKDKNPFLIGFWVLMMACTIAYFVQSQVAWAILGLVVATGVAGAGAETIAHRGEGLFLFRLWRMFLAMYFSLFLGGLLLAGYLLLFSVRVSEEEPWIWIYFYGLLMSPILFPVFLCLVRSARLRPGIDRHFKKRESHEGKLL